MSINPISHAEVSNAGAIGLSGPPQDVSICEWWACLSLLRELAADVIMPFGLIFREHHCQIVHLPSPGAAMSDPTSPDEIFAELIGAFTSECKRPVDDTAHAKLRLFIEVTVFAAADKGLEYRDHRDYLLGNFRGIGADLEARNFAGTVTFPEMIDACVNQVNEGHARLEQLRARARRRGDNARLEALTGEGRICENVTSADLA
jgi:hypothetical protein